MCNTKTGGTGDNPKPWKEPVRVNPHAKVPSVDQDNWLDLMQALYGGLLKHAMKADNRLEEITTLLSMTVEAKNLHISLLNFDEETQQYRDKIQA